MPRLIVEVVADAIQYFATLQKSEKAAVSFTAETTKMGASAKTAAEAQVAAAVRSTEALQQQVAALREVAAAAEEGSAQQTAAARLAEAAQKRLAASMAFTSHEARKLGVNAHAAEAEVGRFSRGMLAGSGLTHSFGRSLAFASGGFLAFEGVAEFIRGTVDASRDAIVSQRQLAAQMKASGESFAATKEEVENAALSYADLGFKASEVNEALVVLERGTGNIDKSMELVGVSADIARAKNIDLSKAALVVAKVFGGQETALRRAVPGLPKIAHGWDLIRAAQEKMAGQAVAGTTAVQRFGSQLFNTEEIIGNALLPTINSLLERFSAWLKTANESGKLEDRVAQATSALAAATQLAGNVIAYVDSITGSFKHTLELLAGVWLTLRLRTAAIRWGTIIAGFADTGAAAAAAEGEVVAFSDVLAGLAVLGPIAIPVVIALSVTQTPEYQKFQEWADKHLGRFGIFSKNIFQVPGEVVKSAKKVVEVWQGILGMGPKGADTFRAQDRPEGPFGAFLQQAETSAKLAARKARAAFTPQQNKWFDARLAREIDRVQDLSLRNQLARLKDIANVIQQRINATHDVTRRLNLQDQLVRVLRQEKSVQEQITGQIKEQNQALKDRAEAIKSAVLDQLDRLQTRVQNQRALQEALRNLRIARAIGGPEGIRAARQAVFDARLDAYRAQVEAKTPTLAHGRFSLGDVITINVHGSEDPEEVARKVVAIWERRKRHGTTPRRGPSAGSSAGPH